MTAINDVIIYTDGACSKTNGGWAAIITAQGVELHRRVVAGFSLIATTSNRMEVLAAVEGLSALERPCSVTVVTDSRYLACTMTEGWKRKKNNDLWDMLDAMVAYHTEVAFEWVKGHSDNPYNDEADQLAVEQRLLAVDAR